MIDKPESGKVFTTMKTLQCFNDNQYTNMNTVYANTCYVAREKLFHKNPRLIKYQQTKNGGQRRGLQHD